MPKDAQSSVARLLLVLSSTVVDVHYCVFLRPRCSVFFTWFLVAVSVLLSLLKVNSSIQACDDKVKTASEEMVQSYDIGLTTDLIEFNIGEHFPRSKVNAILKLQNKTGVDLKMSLSPSCNCTELSPSILDVLANQTVELKVAMATPPAGATTATITARDISNSLRFDIGLSIRAASVINNMVSSFSIESKGDREIEAVFGPTSDSWPITKILLPDDPHWYTKTVAVKDGTWRLGIIRREPPNESTHAENLTLNCLVAKGDGEQSLIPITLRINYTDKFKLGPSTVIPRRSDKRIIFTTYVLGVDKSEVSQLPVAWLSSNQIESLNLTCDSQKERGSGIVFGYSASIEDYLNFVSSSDELSIKLHVRIGDKVAETKVLGLPAGN